MKVKLTKQDDITGGTDLSMTLHRGCGGSINFSSTSSMFLTFGSKAIYPCNKCHKEIDVVYGDLGSFNKHLYVLITQIVDTSKLDPVYKMVEVQNGKIRYTSSMPLDDAGLLKYYGFSGWEPTTTYINGTEKTK